MNPQTKPAHKPTYRERVLAGQVKPKPRSRIKPEKQIHDQTTMKDTETIHTLRDAAHEIRALRRQIVEEKLNA